MRSFLSSGDFPSLMYLLVWFSSSLGRWHPRSSVPLVLTRHSLPILNEWWTRVINLSMFFLLCYGLTTILRSRALHRVLSLAIQYAWRSYMLSRLYRKVKTFRSDLPTYLLHPSLPLCCCACCIFLFTRPGARTKTKEVKWVDSRCDKIM
jgi:hypothetical protein